MSHPTHPVMLCKWDGVEFVNLDANLSVCHQLWNCQGRRQNRPYGSALCVIQAAKQLSNVLMNARQADASNRYINLPKQPPRLCNLSDLESLTNCTAAATIMWYGSIHIIQISMYIHILCIYVFYLGISLASFRKSPKTSWPSETLKFLCANNLQTTDRQPISLETPQ